MLFDVTIAIPVYNVAPYVTRCINSVFSQSHDSTLAVEVLIIDDCSTDNSMQLVDELLLGSPSNYSVRTIKHDQNLGLAEARNTAIREAAGDLIWFVDSDDYVSPKMLQLMLESLDAETDVVMCNVSTVDLSGQRVDVGVKTLGASAWSGRESLEMLYSREIYAFMWNKLIRRSLYEGLVFPRGKIYEDLAIMGSILSRARKVVHRPESLYYYVIRTDSITSAYKENVVHLVENINYGIAMVARARPELANSPLVQNYVVRSAWIPVMNSVAKTSLPLSATVKTVRTVQNEITLRSLLKLLEGGYIVPLGAAILIWSCPNLYMAAYRVFILSRKKNS